MQTLFRVGEREVVVGVRVRREEVWVKVNWGWCSARGCCECICVWYLGWSYADMGARVAKVLFLIYLRKHLE